jgi:glycosyltransferase involved in cell wall biosynthesis
MATESGQTDGSTQQKVLSVVVPLYNEEAVIGVFHERLVGVLAGIDIGSEIVYVNDGSSDGSLSKLRDLADHDSRVAIVDLSRNFGKEIALSAGLDHARGDAVVVIDADLQDPPELIREFVAGWREGYDLVYGQRTEREGESSLKLLSAHAFYRVIEQVGRVRIPKDTGDFRLLSRRAVNALSQLREQHRFMKGLFTWIGFPQKAVPYKRDARFLGTTKWNYWTLWNLALEGITSFTVVPLKVATYLGLVTAIGAFIYGAVVAVKTLAYGNPVPGYPSLMVVVLFLGGMQLMAVGIVGEYLGRVFNETKNRPLYFVNSYAPAKQRGQTGHVDVGFPQVDNNGERIPDRRGGVTERRHARHSHEVSRRPSDLRM